MRKFNYYRYLIFSKTSWEITLQLHQVLEEHFSKYAFLTNKQAAELGITRFQLAALVKKGVLERHKRGVYSEPDELPYDIAFTSLNIGRAILSFNSALFILGMSIRVPYHFEVTVPQGYNASHIKKHLPKVAVNYVKPEIWELGAITVKSPTGDYVRCYNLERTICDLIKYPHKVDSQVYSAALLDYFHNKDRDIFRLMQYANILGITKQVYKYLEVLNF